VRKGLKVADYIIGFLEKKGMSHAFQVPGGGAMFLNDAVARSNMQSIFCHHEQSCAMAAVGYAKVHNKMALVIPTSGCGSTNTITGVLDAWQDSHPLFIVSGQANKKDTTYMSKIPLRKLGAQEVNIIEIIKSITKYSTMVEDPVDIALILEKAYHLATTGRPGPVWIDVPLDVQSEEIFLEDLQHWEPKKQDKSTYSFHSEDFEYFLKKSKRPIIIAGNGIHLADAREEFKRFVEHYRIPCAFTFLGTDLLPVEHPLYIGRLGIKGTRAGNFAVANSDLVISIGSSLSIPVVGYMYELFAREAKKIVIDIDKTAHMKKTIKIDKIIEMDAKQFLSSNKTAQYDIDSLWVSNCQRWREKWPVFKRKDIDQLNMYSFSKALSSLTKGQETAVVVDAGSAYYVMAQSVEDSRLIMPASQGEMGFTVPASIGVSLADRDLKVLAVTGEGSFQFNIQELQTIVQYELPIKLFILNNGGYLSIKNTQTKYFSKRFSGVDPESGISFPESEKIAAAYGIKYFKIEDKNDLEKTLVEVLQYGQCCICEVICPSDEEIYPTAASQQNKDGKITSQPLENMSPFLTEEEFNEEMIIPIWSE
jgi:acetolactate synthase-1/2/3 large subunit